MSQESHEGCQEDHEHDEPAVDDDVIATEKVVNAFLFYKKYGQEKILHMLKQVREIPNEHQKLLGETYREQITEVKQRLDHNYSMLKMIVNYGVGMFGENFMQSLRIHQPRRPTPDYMSKVLSTIRQIAREWSSAGEPERDATYTPIIEELRRLFPDQSKRHDIRIFVPGSGLGRLAFDLMSDGFSVEGNEFSLFMLITSCFLLNGCKKKDEFTLYPFIFDKSNSWSYEDQLRPVTFPDRCPDGTQTSRKNLFSMCAGDFVEIMRKSPTPHQVIVTAWFIDTAHNIVEYIELIHKGLEPGGVWINVGPLTYHFEDMKEESSIELPYEEVMRIVRTFGFQITDERKIDSKYTTNHRSMLQNQYTCAFFVARK
ncbi:unnamed protein product [Caenorhabditis auriculariae]|uniref:carnosine N-methyltransferase n=1 Tax=Caenorhabditis auriculariae TaxID=2777116 RepID=A0A8S1H7F8_9PELO|nr:unnamed protein product [Caenorhabditis auriculariae]